ncbi:MAG: adenylate/guanylate cyclase domain-containing protein [Deltaproteobacteria bacterium]|nr:adenylate/guanylate cyclase domain-containing protein [Deltaproteobacteria bacterium]
MAKLNMFKKRKGVLPLLAICLLISLTAMGTLYHHYSHPSDMSAIGMIENRLLDLRFRLRGPRAASGKVGILAIDEKSLQKFGRWPFARRHYAQIFANLKTLGVDWVGLDLVWSETERTLVEDVAPQLERLAKLDDGNWAAARAAISNIKDALGASPGDQSVHDTIARYGKVVLGYAFYGTRHESEQLGAEPFRGLDLMTESAIQGLILPDKQELDDYPDIRAYGLIANIPLIAQAGKNFAFFNNEISADGIYRWAQLVRNLNGQLMPSLSLKMAAAMTGREPVVFFDNYGVSEISLLNPADDTDIIKIPVDMVGRGRALINHLGYSQSIEHFSLADIYDMTLSDAQKQKLNGMSLILGPTAIGINDLRANPFTAAFDGVEQHATVIDNILSQTFMRRTESIFKTEMGVIAGIFLLFTPLMIFSSAAVSGMGVIVFLCGYYFFDKYYWFSRGEWVYIGMPMIQMLTLFISTTLYKYLTEEREKKKVKGAFSMYLSPDVISQVLDDPNALKLGGEKKELTVFFSDVRSFTTISESLSPEKLCELMNDYFTPMTAIILRSGGVLDKYIGDAVMAFWGAPLPVAGHAEVAAQSAIQMLFALDKLKADLKAKGFPTIDIGIGLNTGSMSVGNMGSNERFCYTVMGDAVNLGARLEGLTKEYGIKVMISEFTRAQIKRPDLFVRDLDDIRVKGKLEPVKVFELMRPDALPQEQAIKNLIGEFELGRAAYRQQDWPRAKRQFTSCLTIRPDDGPANLYLARIAEQSQSPAIPNWDGVYTFKHK